MGYFGEKAANEVPDSLNLEAGEYENVEITQIREVHKKVKDKAGNETGEIKVSVVVTFKDVDPDSATHGLTFDWFIQAPNPDKPATFTYFKRNLKTIGVLEEDMDSVDFMREDSKTPSASENDYVGQTGSLILVQNGTYTNVRSFRLDSDPSEMSQEDAWKKPENSDFAKDTPAPVETTPDDALKAFLS